jgi:hypothetical protein
MRSEKIEKKIDEKEMPALILRTFIIICFIVLIFFQNASAGQWTPVQAAIWPPVQFFGEAMSVYGLRLNLGQGRNENVWGIDAGVINTIANGQRGLQAGLLNQSEDAAGLNLGMANYTKQITGLQAGILNAARDRADGLQAGIILNHSDQVRGIQIGLINISGVLFGIQIGLLNKVEREWLSVLPIINLDMGSPER